MEKKFNATIIGKWIKNGLLSNTPYLSVEFDDYEEFLDLKVSMAKYFKFEKGDKIKVTMEYDEEDGKWYPV